LLGLHIIDISNPDNPTLVTTYGSKFVAGIAARDSMLFVTFNDGPGTFGMLHVLNVADPMNIETLYIDSTNGLGSGLVINGNYLYAGDWNVSVYDVTDPFNPVYYTTSGVTGHQFVIQDSVLYGAEYDWNHILTVNKIENPVTINCLESVDVPGFASYVDVIDKKLCIASALCVDFIGILFYDISAPFAPQPVFCIPNIYGFYLSGHIFARDDTVILYGKGIEIYDATVPEAPKLITAFYDTNRAFGDLVWHGDHIYAVEPENKFWAYDFSSKDSLCLTDTLHIPDILYYEEISITASGSSAYIGEYHNMRVVDISDPESLKLGNKVDFAGYVKNVAVNNDLAYIACGGDGMYIYNVADNENIFEVGHCQTRGLAIDVTISGDYAYVADYDSGLTIVDITDPSSPQTVGGYVTPGYTVNVTADSDLVYIVDVTYDHIDSVGLRVIDVSVPSAPQLAGFYTLGYEQPFLDWYSHILGVAKGTDRMYANTDNGLQIYQYYGSSGIETNASEDKNKYAFRFLSSYPNPAKNNLKINYEIMTPGFYELSVYNILGQKIFVMGKDYRSSGQCSQTWNCSDNNGNKVAPGVYFYQIRDKANNRITQKTILIK